jgi:hypothetical protein
VDSSADPTLNGHLKYPNNLDQSLNDAATDKIRKYRADFYSYRLIGKLTAFSQLQEFSQRNLPVEDSFTFAARFSLLGLKAKLVWLSLK